MVDVQWQSKRSVDVGVGEYQIPGLACRAAAEEREGKEIQSTDGSVWRTGHASSMQEAAKLFAGPRVPPKSRYI